VAVPAAGGRWTSNDQRRALLDGPLLDAANVKETPFVVCALHG